MAKSVSINIKIDTKDGVKSLGDLEKETSTTLKTLKDMEEASELLSEKLKETEVGTDAYKQLRSELIKVNTEIKNQELAMEALDNEQVASELKSVAGGFVDMAGGMALVGSSNKSLEKVVQTMAQVEGATKIVTGAIESYQSMVKLSSTITGVFSKVMSFFSSGQAIAAAKTYALAAAQRVLNLVMNANPIGIIITAVTALIALVGTLTGAFDGIIEGFKSLMGMETKAAKARAEAGKKIRESLRKESEAQQKLIDKVTEVSNKRRKLYDNEIRLLQAKGQNAQKLIEEDIELAMQELQVKIKAIQEKQKIDTKYFSSLAGQRFQDLENAKSYYTNLLHSNNMFRRAQGKAALKIIDIDIKQEEQAKQELVDLEINWEELKTQARDKAHEKKMSQLKAEKELALSNAKGELEVERLKAEAIEDEIVRKQKLAEIDRRLRDEEIMAMKVSNEIKQELFLLNQQKFDKIEADLQLERESREKRRQQEWAEKRRANFKKVADMEVQIEREKEQTLLEIWKQNVSNWQQLNAEKIKTIQESFKIASEAISGIFQATQDIMSEQAAQASFEREEQYSKESESLKASLANREISQEQYENKLALLDQKKRNEERMAARKAFQMDKAMRLSQAIMGTAQAVVSGLSAPFPLGVIQAGINAALGAVQVGIISAQKFRAARGGIVPGAPSSVDTVDAKLAQGEAVINSNSTQMFAPLLSAINEMGGGIPLVPSAGVTQSNTQPVFQENQKQTVKAYVVQSEISDANKKVSRIERAASFK